MNKKTLDQVSVLTGLSTEACRNMLDAGWTYVEDIAGNMRWEAPISVVQ